MGAFILELMYGPMCSTGLLATLTFTSLQSLVPKVSRSLAWQDAPPEFCEPSSGTQEQRSSPHRSQLLITDIPYLVSSFLAADKCLCRLLMANHSR